MKKGKANRSVRLFELVFVFLFSTSVAYGAAEPEAGSSDSEALESEAKVFSFSSQLAVKSGVLEPSDDDYRASAELTLIPSFRLAEGLSLSVLQVVAKSFVNDEEWTYSDPSVGIRYSEFKINDYFSFSPGGGVRFGLSKSSRKQTSLIMALRAQPRLNWSLDPVASGLSGYYQLGFNKNFHEFTKINKIGESNTSFNMTHTFNAGYSFIDSLRLSLNFVVVNKWTYEGSVGTDYNFGQELAYQINEMFSAGVGHYTEGNAFKPNGIDNNIQLFDGQDSTFYAYFGFGI